jgi:hypothetical protein
MLLKLCARTQLEGDNQIWPGEPDVLNTLRQRIEVSQQRGLIRSDLCSSYISIMVLGLVYFWLQGREHFVQRFGEAVNDDHFIEQAITMLEQGLAPMSDATKATSVANSARDEDSDSV